MKKRIIILSSCLLIIGTIIAFTLKTLTSNDPEYVVDFIKNHPQKVSLVIKEEEKLIFEFNGEKKVPIASLFKLIVLYELIDQVNRGLLNFNDRIKLSDIEDYNYSSRVNHNYSVWKEKEVKNQDQVTIEEIVRGMMTYSANPNTDYLMHRLGMDRINKSAKKLTNNRHSKILPVGASVLVPYYLMNEKKIEEKSIRKLLKNSSKDKYEKLVFKTFDYLHSSNQNEDIDYYPSDSEQIIWSKNGPKSTALDYINVLNKILGLKMPKGINLSNLMKVNYEQPLDLIGKNGETINSVNKIIHLNGKNVNRSVILLTHNLDKYDQLRLKNSIDTFMIKTITKEYTYSKK